MSVLNEMSTVLTSRDDLLLSQDQLLASDSSPTTLDGDAISLAELSGNWTLLNPPLDEYPSESPQKPSKT